MEETRVFEKRKRDHIELALDERNQTAGLSGFDQVQLVHEALPEINFSEIDISTSFFSEPVKTPFFISSMTAGHEHSLELNLRLARISAKKGWLMGVGSQRRQLFDIDARREWELIREQVPDAKLLGNLGVAQVIETPGAKVQELVDSLQASGMIVHLNALQECLQPEGTPSFKGGLAAIERLAEELNCPLIVKETGCGMSKSTIKKLLDVGVSAVDVSGLGGTHWGRIEGKRSEGFLKTSAETFENWGISTVQSLTWASGFATQAEVWASGGVRSGLDAAKAFALGAARAGFAKPALEAAMAGEEMLESWMTQTEYELKVAMFCTGSRKVVDLRGMCNGYL